jgi:hypothetical protein
MAQAKTIDEVCWCHNPRLTLREAGGMKILFESCQQDTPKVLSFTGSQHAVGEQQLSEN